MGVSLEEDQKRKIIELALQAGRKRLSPQTGFVHFYAEDPYALRQDTIPVIENFSYVLALFRSKLVENIQEGKILLDKLLNFEVEGNYPVYLHEFPTCVDSQLSSHLLPILFYLIRDFTFALGDVLMEKVKALKERIVKCLQNKKDLSKGAHYRLLSFLGTCDLNEWSPDNPTALAEWCICAQMTNFPLDKALSCFDSNHLVFIGKTKDRLQEGLEPAVTLLDLFMGEYLGEFSARSLLSHQVHLRASIVYPSMKKEIKKNDNPYTVLIEEDKRQCFTLYWGDKNYTDSLTVEAKKGSWNILEKTGSLFELLYTPNEAFPSEEESVECALYVSAHKDVGLTVNGVLATAFHENDLLSIMSPSRKIDVKFSTDKGTWIGHISKANRSFQRKVDGYAAYDLKIGWRTLRRAPDAKVVIEINIR